MADTPEDRSARAASPAVTDEINALPTGTRFGELEILSTLGVGGFGIVYLAQDHALERQVAIKEYMPGQLAQRGDGSQVSVRSGSLLETFAIGRRSFVNEARLLARFDHRSILKVYQFWEANGTAYMAMPYLQGETLRQARQAMKDRPSEAWMLRVLLPVLDGLAMLHAESVFHRDIAPDNILLPLDGSDAILWTSVPPAAPSATAPRPSPPSSSPAMRRSSSTPNRRRCARAPGPMSMPWAR